MDTLQSYIHSLDFTSTNTLILGAIAILTIALVYKIITNLVYIVVLGFLIYFLVQNYNRDVLDLFNNRQQQKSNHVDY